VFSVPANAGTATNDAAVAAANKTFLMGISFVTVDRQGNA
jgi:hypothetical protein